MKFSKPFIWVVLILTVFLVLYAVFRQGQTITEVNIGGDLGVLIKFDKLKEISKNDLKNRQDKLETKLSKVEKDFHKIPQDSQVTQQFNINGTWQSNSGSSYIINQYGNAVSIQEVHPFYGITAIGEGLMTQRDVNISYLNAFYSKGNGILHVVDNKRIDGQFTDSTTKFTTRTTLYR
jgi:hypothetical protein